MLPFEIHRTAIGVYMLELVRKSILGHESMVKCMIGSNKTLFNWISLWNIQKWVPLLFTIGLTKFLEFNHYYRG